MVLVLFITVILGGILKFKDQMMQQVPKIPCLNK